MMDHMAEHLDIYMCPSFGRELGILDGQIECSKWDHTYSLEDDVPFFVLDECRK